MLFSLADEQVKTQRGPVICSNHRANIRERSYPEFSKLICHSYLRSEDRGFR